MVGTVGGFGGGSGRRGIKDRWCFLRNDRVWCWRCKRSRLNLYLYYLLFKLKSDAAIASDFNEGHNDNVVSPTTKAIGIMVIFNYADCLAPTRCFLLRRVSS
mgnify:CR=1 FL=1